MKINKKLLESICLQHLQDVLDVSIDTKLLHKIVVDVVSKSKVSDFDTCVRAVIDTYQLFTVVPVDQPLTQDFLVTDWSREW